MVVGAGRSKQLAGGLLHALPWRAAVLRVAAAHLHSANPAAPIGARPVRGDGQPTTRDLQHRGLDLPVAALTSWRGVGARVCGFASCSFQCVDGTRQHATAPLPRSRALS